MDEKIIRNDERRRQVIFRVTEWNGFAGQETSMQLLCNPLVNLCCSLTDEGDDGFNREGLINRIGTFYISLNLFVFK